MSEDVNSKTPPVTPLLEGGQGNLAQATPPSEVGQGNLAQATPPSEVGQGNLAQATPPSEAGQGNLAQATPSSEAGRGNLAQTTPLNEGGLRGEKKIRRLPYNPNLTDLAKQLRKNMSPAERKLWYVILQGKKFRGYKFLRQRPIGNYIVDFYCSELSLIIEVDGESHTDNQVKDIKRTHFLESLGLRLIRVSNIDIMENIEGVYDCLCQAV